MKRPVAEGLEPTPGGPRLAGPAAPIARIAVRAGESPSRYREVLRHAGLLWLSAAPFIALPLLLLPFVPGEADLWWRFLVPAAGLALAGLRCWQLVAPSNRALRIADGALVVTLGWVGAILAAAVAFALAADMSLTHAMFEATSAWTTTGLSVVDVERASRTVLFLRSVLEFAGGIGLAVVMISVVGGPPGTGLAVAEGRAQQLAPHVAHSAKLVFGLCAGYATVGAVALRMAGMPWFDAVNHAMAAVSTGGFSTRTDSIGAYDSVAVEAVTVVLMLLGTTNLVVAWHALRGRPKALWHNGETRLLATLLPIAALLVLVTATGPLYATAGKAVRVAVFETVSALSTTGFSTVGYRDWPVAAMLVLVALMLVGGGAGSTAGGLKLARVYVLARSMLWEVERALLPRRAINRPRIVEPGGSRLLEPEEARTVGIFASTYLAVFAVGAWFMTTRGFELHASLFEMASTLGTVGLSIGITSPDAPTAVLWLQIFAMLLGRLEIFVVVVALARLGLDLRGVLRAYASSKRNP